MEDRAKIVVLTFVIRFKRLATPDPTMYVHKDRKQKKRWTIREAFIQTSVHGDDAIETT
jgi:hypothetical protein